MQLIAITRTRTLPLRHHLRRTLTVRNCLNHSRKFVLQEIGSLNTQGITGAHYHRFLMASAVLRRTVEGEGSLDLKRKPMLNAFLLGPCLSQEWFSPVTSFEQHASETMERFADREMQLRNDEE